MYKYKTVSNTKYEFDRKLNEAINDGWNLVGDITTCYVSQFEVVEISILLSKFIKDEENNARQETII